MTVRMAQFGCLCARRVCAPVESAWRIGHSKKTSMSLHVSACLHASTPVKCMQDAMHFGLVQSCVDTSCKLSFYTAKLLGCTAAACKNKTHT